MKLLRSVTFLSAFLLFQIELIISKILLPHFGGSYLVWAACVVFFQGVLLGGYLYSHYVVVRFGIARYRNYHLVLFVLPALLFLSPVHNLSGIRLHQDIPMVFDVFWQLALSIGLVFFALSTMAVISQSWLAASELPERRHPYALYAVSNLGSFAALLTYPFVVEPFFGLDTQLLIWRVAYSALLIMLFVLVKAVRVNQSIPAEGRAPAAVDTMDKVRWLLFSAGSVIAFLAVTNIITYEITPVPLFWVIPLSIYLLSYVLVFKERSWCPAWIVNKFHYATGLSIGFFFLTQRRIIPMFIEILAYYFILFVVCMFCQAKLLSYKPQHKRNLTAFYVYIATGGFFGGIIAGWLVPVLSTMMIEFFLSLFVVHLVFFIEERNTLIGFYLLRLTVYLVIFLMLWPVLFAGYHFVGIVVLAAVLKLIYQELSRSRKAVFMSVAVVFFLAPFLEPFWLRSSSLFVHRNYYGIYRVQQDRESRSLMNGTTLHGMQYRAGARALEPAAYYHPDTPLGRIMASEYFSFNDIGIVGLGIGGIAAWGKEGQRIDYYELDPDVYDIARTYFTYAEKSPASLRYIFGDARLRIAEKPAGSYDLLIIDAFSGDSIPVHLLTSEAIREYRRVLKDGGIILFHVSNRYLDLTPVVISNARSAGLMGVHQFHQGDRKKDCFASSWVLVTASPQAHRILSEELGWSAMPTVRIRPWTDQRSTIVPVFKMKALLDSLRGFRPFWWYPIRNVPPLFNGIFTRLGWVN